MDQLKKERLSYKLQARETVVKTFSLFHEGKEKGFSLFMTSTCQKGETGFAFCVGLNYGIMGNQCHQSGKEVLRDGYVSHGVEE